MTVPAYDGPPGFRIDTAEADAYLRDIQTALGRPLAGQRALELGCGTGEFTSFLAANGVEVTGVDQSLSRARQRLPTVPLLTGDITTPDADVVACGRFDLLVSRYVIHELPDPVRAFRAWSSLLHPDGRIVLIENCWIRSDWGHGDWGRRNDSLPLACTQAWATGAYLLGLAGLPVRACRWMDTLNSLRKHPPRRWLPPVRHHRRRSRRRPAGRPRSAGGLGANEQRSRGR